MYAHRVQPEPNSAAAMTQRLEQHVIPMLRKQTEFQHEITVVGGADIEHFIAGTEGVHGGSSRSRPERDH